VPDLCVALLVKRKELRGGDISRYGVSRERRGWGDVRERTCLPRLNGEVRRGGGGGGSVGAEGWRRISREEKGPVQKRRDEIRAPSVALRGWRIQEETILDCKQGSMETGEKEFTVDLRGEGGGRSKTPSPCPSPPDPPHGRVR